MASPELTAFERALPEGRRVVAVASADLAPQAGSLLDTLVTLDARGPRLADGSSIQFGWSRLTLHQPGPSPILYVHEPDFFGDPEHRTVAHVDTTLRVLRDQAWLVHLCQAAPRDTAYHQAVVCERSALAKDECYFERRPPLSDRDSGWLAGSAAPNAKRTLTESDLITLPAYYLLREFPAAVPVLTLPVGSLAVFRWDELFSICSPNGSMLSLPSTRSRNWGGSGNSPCYRPE